VLSITPEYPPLPQLPQPSQAIMKFLISALLLAAVVGVVLAAPQRRRGSSYDQNSDELFETPKYEFQWGVKDDASGNMYNHMESRDDDVTRGAYYVALPDGRVQKVTYYVDGDSGFVAEISYE